MSDERHDERYYEGWSHDELRAALADLRAERDRLRADLDVSTADIDRYVAALQEILTFVSREPGTLAGRLWMIADQALDVSPAMGEPGIGEDHGHDEEPASDRSGGHGNRDDRAHPLGDSAVRDDRVAETPDTGRGVPDV